MITALWRQHTEQFLSHPASISFLIFQNQSVVADVIQQIKNEKSYCPQQVVFRNGLQ